MDDNYIDILIQSLEKKIKVLEAISQENANQKKMLCEEVFDMDAFHQSVDVKAELIENVSFLDDGFEKMYDRVKSILDEGREAYREKIKTMQELVRQITEKAIQVQIEEASNHKLATRQFGSMKKKVREVKTTSQVANKYYESMSKLNYVDPQFMDKKK